MAPAEKVVEAGFQFQAFMLQGRASILRPHPERVSHQQGYAAQRQRQFKPVPGVKGQLAAGSHGHGEDGGLGLPGQVEGTFLGHPGRPREPSAIMPQL